MDEAIERLSFGGILDKSFQLLRENFRPLVGSLCLVQVPTQLLIEYVGDAAQLAKSGGFSSSHLIAFAGFLLLHLMALPLLQLANNLLIAGHYLSRPVPFSEALGRAKNLYVPFLGTTLLISLVVGLLALLLIVPGVYFAVCWALVGPIAAVEETFGTRALRRSRKLVRGYWLRTFGVPLVGALISVAVNAGASMAFAFLPVVGSIVEGIISATTTAFLMVAGMVVYVDLRCRKEDFDLKLLAHQLATDPESPEMSVA